MGVSEGFWQYDYQLGFDFKLKDNQFTIKDYLNAEYKEQAGAELCQAQHSLSYSPISWNLATQKLGAS